MSLQRTVARNVIWNWAGIATHMAAGFITFPILVGRLGESDLGLWLLILSLIAYFDLFDFGLRGSLGRNIAFFKAKNDIDGVNSVFNTGMALLLLLAGVVLLATAGGRFVFFELFEVRPEAQQDVSTAIWLIGLNLALVFLFNGFEGFLWGHQRFDLLNFIEIPAVLLRLVLVFFLIDGGSQSLITLGVIHLAVTLTMGIGWAICSFALSRELRFGFHFVRLSTARHLFNFGIWYCLLMASQVISVQLGPFFIGNRLAIALVTPYNAAARLVAYVKSIFLTGTGVLTPLVTAWHANEDESRQRFLFLYGGKLCMSLGLFFLGGFVFLGEQFLWLWTGKHLQYAFVVLTVLMLGELLPLSQWITYSIVIGKDRHRLWAIMSLVEVGLILLFGFVFLMIDRSIISVVLAVAIPGAFCRGLIQMIYACRLLDVSIGIYLFKAMLPALGAAVIPMGFLGMAATWMPPDSWAVLLGWAVAYALVYALFAGLFVIGLSDLKRILQSLRGKHLPETEQEALADEPAPTIEPSSGVPLIK